MGRQHALAHLSHEAVLGKFEQAVHALIKSQPAEVTA